MQDTPKISAFAETAALYAVLNEDYDEARRIAGQKMTLNERLEFIKQLGRLTQILENPLIALERIR